MEVQVSTIERFRDGDREAFEQLYRLESHRLGRFLRRYARSAETAEDIFQEVWLTAWCKRTQLRDPRRFTSWFYQIARRQALMHFRRQSSRPEFTVFGQAEGGDAAADPLASVPDPGPDARHNAQQAQWLAAVEAEIGGLDEGAREMLALRFGADLNLREVADVMELPLGTVCSKVSRSLKDVRKRLSRKGIQWEA